MKRTLIARALFACALVSSSASSQAVAPAPKPTASAPKPNPASKDEPAKPIDPVDAKAKHFAASQRPKRSIMPIPYVGQITNVDLTTGMFTLLGPDGKSMDLKCPKRFMDPVKGPLDLSELPQRKGWYVGVLLKDLQTARGIIMIGKKLEPAAKFYLNRTFPADEVIEFGNPGGLFERFRPTVNLGASAVGDVAPVTASWDWFEAHLKQPYYVRVVELFGDFYIWDLKPWDPKTQPDTEFGRPPRDGAASTP